MKTHIVKKPSYELRIIGWLSFFGDNENLKNSEIYGKIIIENEKRGE